MAQFNSLIGTLLCSEALAMKLVPLLWGQQANLHDGQRKLPLPNEICSCCMCIWFYFITVEDYDSVSFHFSCDLLRAYIFRKFQMKKKTMKFTLMLS